MERSKQILIEEFELVKTMPKGCNWYAVQLKSGPIIGNLLLKKATYLNNPLELGWHFAKKYQGKGFATEAANPFIEYCFNEFNINYLTAIIVKDNEPSRNLAKRVSMKKSKQKIDYKGYIHELWEINKKDFNKI